MTKSIEEEIEDWAKLEFKNNKTKYFSKTESINSEIENALSVAPSKSGGSGENKPDIKLFVETLSMKKYPVMIEVKGTKGKLVKLNSSGEIDNYKKDGTPNWKNIQSYAVNGAIHYANAIINNSTYTDVIAVGINGYNDTDNQFKEIEIYFVSKDNFCIPKKISGDLSILFKTNWNELENTINQLSLTEDEKEKIAKENENTIEANLKELNQLMRDDLNISTNSRVKLVAGMIMAGLGVPGKVSSLSVSDLKGELGINTNDGQVFINKIKDFLTEKEIPEEKRAMVITDLSLVFLTKELYKPNNGESKLKKLYICIDNKIMPYTESNKVGFLDFTGKLFNVLMDWVEVPDGGDNDVVLTPRYVTDLMAKLCKVNKESYVWDYAVGTAGFLVSSMRLMLADADKSIINIQEKETKKCNIKCKQLLGIEKRPDIYLLAVLNMILMGDGTTNILQADSLTDFDGNYAQGNLKGQPFPANVFLLNPPYSALGKGFVFVKKALSRMTHGRAAVLIQENAGTGNGLPYTRDLLEKNKLIASIHMADIFKGKAGVQTAVYVFEIGTPHNENDDVVFINMSNDGYVRSNRKKATIKTNLKNIDHAVERYDEVVDIVLGRKKKTDFYKENEDVIHDTISLSGKDWTFNQHVKIDTKPKEDDFKKCIFNYLSWKANSSTPVGGK